MKYLVRVTETLAHTVVVEANSIQEAEDKVNNAYDDGQIVLDYDDFDEYDIEVQREATDFDKGLYDILEVDEYISQSENAEKIEEFSDELFKQIDWDEIEEM